MKVCFSSCNPYNNSQRVYGNNVESNRKNPSQSYDLNTGFGRIKSCPSGIWGPLVVGAATLYFGWQIIRALLR